MILKYLFEKVVVDYQILLLVTADYNAELLLVTADYNEDIQEKMNSPISKEINFSRSRNLVYIHH